ncbi:hypothetical protein [Nocardia sp. NPDC004604]|uniref:hypothetical protein n=1 Tax=Nocardia sp. NPDC004604 TaxID=3157013 RepID=UPI00339F2E45
MDESGPTVVVVYDVGSGRPRKVAEFRLTAAGTATLNVTDPSGCLVAQHWYDRGINVYDLPERIGPRGGTRFLRALLETPTSSYYRLVDESPPPRPRG